MIGTVVVEVGLYIAGIALYLRCTTAKDKIGSIGFWLLAGFLGLTYVGNLAGPPPSRHISHCDSRQCDVAFRRVGLLGGQTPDGKNSLKLPDIHGVS
jgi:hypothetical protein